MDYRKQVTDDMFMEKYLEHQALRREWRKDMLDQKISPVKGEAELLKKENERLKQRVTDLEAELHQKKENVGNVRIQYQMLHYLFPSNPIINASVTLEQKGIVLGYLLNRHSQRARKPLSALHNLVHSTNKGEATNIKKDLTKVKELFELVGLKEATKRLEADLSKLQ